MKLVGRVRDGTGRINAGLRIVESMRAKWFATDVGDLVVQQTSRRLTKEKRDPDGQAWAPWSRAYARSKPRRSTPGGILNLFGLLRRSIKSRVSNWGGRDKSIVRVLPEASGLTAPVADYADVHQFGSRKRSKRNIPARAYLGLSSRNIEQIEKSLIKKFKGAFGW